MQNTSATYNQIISGEHSFEVKVNIAGTDYGMDSIFSMSTSSKLWEQEPTIGGVYSAHCNISLLTDGAGIPRMAKCIPYFRAVNASDASEWIKKGEFYIDTREVSDNGGGINVLNIYACDAMLKANAVYATSTLSWPATDTVVLAEICSALGLTQDPRNAAVLTGGYSVNLPSDETYRDILSYIGVMYAANWIITDEGYLRIVPISGGTDTLSAGQEASTLETSPVRGAYTKVSIGINDGNAIESGSSDENVMEAYCPPITQAIADSVYSTLSSWQYKPFVATGVWSDPAVEVGDQLTVGSLSSTIYSRDITFGSGMTMQLGAPFDEYIDHEYAFESPKERRYTKTVKNINSQIEILGDKIALVVEEVDGQNLIKAASIVLAINEAGSSVQIDADHISLNGMAIDLTSDSISITSDNFSVDSEGNITATGANISGTFNITGGSIDISTSSLTDDKIRLKYLGCEVNMSPSKLTFSYSGLVPLPNATMSRDGFFATTADTNPEKTNLVNITPETIELGKFTGTQDNPTFASGFKVSQSYGDSVEINIISPQNVKRMSLLSSGLTFKDNSGNTTFSYPAAGLGTADLVNNNAELISASGTAKTYTLANGTYLISTCRINNTSKAQDGLWLAEVYEYSGAERSHISDILTPTGGTVVTVASNVLTVTTGSANVRVTITKLS